MKPRTKSALQQCNKVLQKGATVNYRRLLIRVTQVHNSACPAMAEVRRLLDGPITKTTVKALVELADSLAGQKYPDAARHFAANQLAALIRKYPFSRAENPFDPEKTAYSKFTATERRCRKVAIKFRLRRSRKGKAVPYEAEMERMRQFIRYVLGDSPDMSNIYSKIGFGPGANVGLTGDATNFARKLRADWTVTPGAYHYAFVATMNHPQLREVILPDHKGFTSGLDDYDPFKGPFSKKVKVVDYNKLSFVLKKVTTHRSVAPEPIENGLLEKGIDVDMRDKLRRIGIDLSDQEPNSKMAREGSLGGEDPFITADMTESSDSIVDEPLKDLFPPDWYDLMSAVRCRNYIYKGAKHRYSKFCTMGNGFCFPLQTLVFTAALMAVDAGRPGIDFRVYGDDIVCRRSVSDKAFKLLRYLGFRINTGKTFVEGPFRESCGGDWFSGVDVRPYTLDIALDSVQAIFKVLNGSLRNSMTIDFFEELRPFLLRLIPPEFRFHRPFTGPADSGIDPFGDEFLTSQHSYYIGNRTGKYGPEYVGRWFWKELVSVPVEDREIKRWAREHGYAMLYAALVGSASDLPFSLRRKTRTKVRVISHPGATSSWLPPVDQIACQRHWLPNRLRRTAPG